MPFAWKNTALDDRPGSGTNGGLHSDFYFAQPKAIRPSKDGIGFDFEGVFAFEGLVTAVERKISTTSSFRKHLAVTLSQKTQI